ncbi:hypothetical protein AZZ81_001439 [Klebsiella aerogenes]|nr:hypothetical protein AZZ81_001439 [Klebsiella aerogenes]
MIVNPEILALFRNVFKIKDYFEFPNVFSIKYGLKTETELAFQLSIFGINQNELIDLVPM